MATQITVQVESDRSNAAITIVSDGVPGDPVILSPPDLEELIENLGKARAHLSDPVPEVLDGTLRKNFLLGASWSVQPSPDGNGKAVLVRHPGFGWLGFVVQNDVAKQLAQLLGD